MSRFEKAKSGYYFLGAVPFSLRFLIIAGCLFVGIYMQLNSHDLFPGVLFVLVAAGFSLRRGLDLKVSSSKRNVEWETVPFEKWENIKQLRKKTNKWKSSFSNIISGKGATVFVLVVVGAIVFSIVMIDLDPSFTVLFLVNVILFALPVFLSGAIWGFNQPELDVKLKALVKLYEDLKKKHGELELQPMLGLGKGKQDDVKGKVPVDAKMMIKLPDQPKEFYGVQVNCSLNKVSGANYPYVYAVVLTSPAFDMDHKHPPKPKGKNLVYEPSTTAEATVLVIRQRTTKTSGYHTNASQQLAVVESAIDLGQRLLSYAGY